MLTDEFLSLRRNVHVVPQGGGRVLLYRKEQPSVLLSGEGIDVLAVAEELRRGTWRADLAARHGGPGTDEQLHALLEHLRGAGFLHLPARGTGLDPGMIDRFDRLLAYLGKLETGEQTRFDSLARIRQAHVVMLGLGSLGSWVLVHLLASGVGRVTIVDGDVVQPSNLSRQALYAEGDVGEKKVFAARRAAARLSSLTEVEVVDRQLDGPEAVDEVLDGLKEVAIVVVTADRPVWRIVEWTTVVARRRGLPLLRGNMQGLGPLALDGHTACPMCAWPPIADEIVGATEILSYNQSQRVPSAASSAAISTEIAVQGSLMAHEVLSFLSRAEPLQSVNRQLRAQLCGGAQVAVTELPPHPRCPVCTKRP